MTKLSTTAIAVIATKGLSAPEDPVNGVIDVVVEWWVDDAANDEEEDEEVIKAVFVVVLGLLVVPVAADVEPVVSEFAGLEVSMGVAVESILDDV